MPASASRCLFSRTKSACGWAGQCREGSDAQCAWSGTYNWPTCPVRSIAIHIAPKASGAGALAQSLLHALDTRYRVGEAETELLSLVSHEDITADVALAALKLAVATPGGLASVKASLPLVLERFAGGCGRQGAWLLRRSVVGW